jgi:hypothetical protein
MHSTDNLEDGYMGSGTRLARSKRKYGVENHKIEILEFASDRKALREREKELITEEMLHDPMCMNLAFGGGEIRLTKEQYKDRNLKCQQLRLVKYEDPVWLEKHKAKLREGVKKRLSSDAWLKNHVVPDWNGKNHSDETKKLMSESHTGEKNSQFGTCWIFSVIEKRSMKVPLEEIDKYLSQGWQKGRKMNFEENGTG